jgi:hypothetical protein
MLRDHADRRYTQVLEMPIHVCLRTMLRSSVWRKSWNSQSDLWGPWQWQRLFSHQLSKG